MAGSSAEPRNVGFRRFTNIVREARFRSPDAPTSLKMGTAVEIDLADPTKVREVTANSTGAVGADVEKNLVGMIWYEHDSQNIEGVAAGTLWNEIFQNVPAGRMCQVVHGPGVKIWLRNTDQDTTEPGLNYPNTRAAVTMVTGLGAAGVSVGDWLGWDDASSTWTVTTTPEEAILSVTWLDDAAKILEAEFLV